MAMMRLASAGLLRWRGFTAFKREAGVLPAARATGQVVHVRESVRLGDAGCRLATHSRCAHEDHAVTREQCLWGAPQALERNYGSDHAKEQRFDPADLFVKLSERLAIPSKNA